MEESFLFLFFPLDFFLGGQGGGGGDCVSGRLSWGCGGGGGGAAVLWEWCGGTGDVSEFLGVVWVLLFLFGVCVCVCVCVCACLL